MKKTLIYIFILVTLNILNSDVIFSANELFRSKVSGNWNATSTWEMSTNGGTNWIAATLTPNENSGAITVRFPNTVTVTVNVNADQLTIDNGSISINTGIVLTLLNGTGDDLTVLSGGIVTGTGTFQTQGTSVVMNLRTGSNFNAALKVNTGTVTVSELSSPYDCRLFGNVTVDAGATLNTNNTSSYTLFIYGNLTNNGTITGSGSDLRFLGAALVNTGTVSTPDFYFDSTSAVSGTGLWNGGTITVGSHGNVTLLNNVTFSPVSKFSISTGGIFSANNFILTFTSGTFEILTGGTVANSGTVRTQNNVNLNPKTGSSFNANLNVNTGTTIAAEIGTPYNGRLYGNVTVDAGATLNTNNSSSYTLFIYGNLTNDGTITGSGSDLRFLGAALVNTGTVSTPDFYFDSTSAVSGTGSWNGGTITVGSHGNVTLLNNVTFSPVSKFSISTGGIFSANNFILTFTSGTFEILTGGTVVNSGTVKTQNNVYLNPKTGSSFNANLNVNTGTTIAAEIGTPYNGRLYGNVTVDAGATLNTNNTSSYTLFIYGNLTNNGTITGSGSDLRFLGAALVNTGTVSTPDFYFDSTSAVSGTGSWNGGTITVGSHGNVTLLNNVTFSLISGLSISTGGVFSANSNILTFTSGTFEILTGGTVANSGTVRTQNNVNLNPKTGSSFNANLNVNTGTTIAAEIGTPYNGRLYGNITVDAGATLNSNNSESYTLFIFGNIINNGTISGVGDIKFQSGAHTLQGTGIWTTEAFLLSGAVVTLNSNHQMFSVIINTGAAFDISNRVLGLTASNPITQNGTFTTTNSKIEYNGTSLQSVSFANITYAGLRINNPAGATLLNNISVNDTLSVISGDLNLNTRNITISSTGYLTETPGNTIFGNSGYVTTTRNIGTPTALNVGGLGAVLTATSNLGSTEIKRGHTVQTGLNGGTSIKRYFDITPANNSGLNASLIFKFDDTELNAKPESSLQLFKSLNSGSTWTYQGGTVNVNTNEITLTGISSFSRWSADSSKVSASIGLIMEGFYNTVTNKLNMRDTVRAYLRSILSPYAVIDSAKELLDSLTFKAAYHFANAPTGMYYIQLQHRNSIETWSRSGGVSYTAGNTLNYDFTTDSAKAYGNNMKKISTKWTIYGGDVLQDGLVELADVSLIDNDAGNFVNGYVNTDVNGDGFVDLDDQTLADNNAYNFVAVSKP